MIKPISREYFYKMIPEKTEYIKSVVRIKALILDLDISDKRCFKFPNLGIPIFFEKPGEGFFVYLNFNNIVLIPEKYKDLKISEDETVDFTDWELELVSNEPDKRYTKNCLEFTSIHSDGFYNSKDLFSEIKSGDYIIKNNRIGFSEAVTIRQVHSWYDNIQIGFPERLVQPYDMKVISDKDQELRNMLAWTQN
jgi:hypothetical protein